jgi:hypothetical protein
MIKLYYHIPSKKRDVWATDPADIRYDIRYRGSLEIRPTRILPPQKENAEIDFSFRERVIRL